MWPAPPWSSAKEWSKLDLLPLRISRLILTWLVPYSEEAVTEFGGLLDLEGKFVGVLSYNRHRVRHHRIEAAQVGVTESDALTVSLLYQVGDTMLTQLPKSIEEQAWLIDPLLKIGLTIPIAVHTDLSFPSAANMRSAVPLPLAEPFLEAQAAFDEIVGLRGVKRATGGDESTGHRFILDREDNGDLELSLDFSLAPGPADRQPELALHRALEIAESIVFKA